MADEVAEKKRFIATETSIKTGQAHASPMATHSKGIGLLGTF